MPTASNPQSSRSWFRRTATPVPSPRSQPVPRFFVRLFGLVLLVALAWSFWVVHRINQVASEDQAQPADAIVVFGAAEYSGRPSPVYHARLDHAVALYQHQIAPRIITLGGGSNRDSGLTEGGVGRDYLLAQGVPFAAITAETNTFTTAQQAHRLAIIASDDNLHHLVVVSDPTHLFRIQQLCEQEGLDVYTSPRPPLGHIDDFDLTLRYAHEVLSYTALRLHLDDTFLHKWFDGKGED